MCYYIKDNNEKCGRDADPFCHQHEDTKFAALWEHAKGAESASSGKEGVSICNKCEEPVRSVVASVEPTSYSPRTMVEVREELTCGCDVSVEYRSERGPRSDVPETWLNQTTL